MSAHVRARRPASPPPQYDADRRKELASRGSPPHRSRYYPPGGLNISSAEWKLLFLIVVVASTVRLFRLAHPDSVVFDEVHFGKFASKYIKTQYFVDVHPPLAKLLITLTGFAFGYDGQFDFKEIGKPYTDVPYVAMRMLPATLGVATVPISYLTLRILDCRATTALLAAVFLTFENGLVTQSRHILLDSPLVFFTALTIFLWSGFCNEDKFHQNAFTPSWWTWLTLSGLSLGAVVSCKWVGLFTIATVGCSTILQLWKLLGDLKVSPRWFVRHFAARAMCLIVVPIVFYMIMFQIHFLILENSGEGDGFMSSEFQHTLGGRHMNDTFADVAVGSLVTIRHKNTQGGYLHSHPHNYPGGSQQQQITLYPHRDSNNDWQIINASYPGFEYASEPLDHIVHLSKIRLQHVLTGKHLHSHDHRPPVSDVDFQNEVSGYGLSGFAGDSNDDWVVEIEHGDERDKEAGKRVRTLRTVVRFRHAMTGCYLFSHKVKLPEWGFEQQEVTCNKNAVKANSLWFVETAWHERLPADAPKVNYKTPGFFSKFMELQQVMWMTNQGLTDRHTFDSRPHTWPRLIRGINFWVKDHKQIYLIGNPVVWYLSTFAVVVYILVRGVLILREKRGYQDFASTQVTKYESLCSFLFLGWFLHYFPFYLMGRQLFLHHYFPALYFAVLLFCSVFDGFMSSARPRVRLQIAGVLMVVAVWQFVRLSPLVYGTEWTKEECYKSKWVKTWDFGCNDFYDNYSQYHTFGTPLPPSQVDITVGGEEGGRPAIIIPGNNGGAGAGAGGAGADQVANHDHHIIKDDHRTSIVEGKPEPGRDVFAIAQGDVKSVGNLNLNNLGGVEQAATTTTAAAAVVEENEKEKGGVEDGVHGPVVGGTEKSSLVKKDDSTTTTTAAVVVVVVEKKNGGDVGLKNEVKSGVDQPLSEAELEAQRVAEELFS